MTIYNCIEKIDTIGKKNSSRISTKDHLKRSPIDLRGACKINVLLQRASSVTTSKTLTSPAKIERRKKWRFASICLLQHVLPRLSVISLFYLVCCHRHCPLYSRST